MTSGAFTAAHLALIPQLERLTKKTIVTASTSVGTGETSIPNRLKRGEVVDIERYGAIARSAGLPKQ